MEDIFSRLNSITNSDEYKKYKEIGKILESDTSIKILQDEIENLQKEALILEYQNNLKYLVIEKEIARKVDILNNNKTYKIYLEKMKEYNDFIKNE